MTPKESTLGRTRSVAAPRKVNASFQNIFQVSVVIGESALHSWRIEPGHVRRRRRLGRLRRERTTR